MPMSFTYTAKDAVGNIRKGVMTAEDEQEFLAKIREKGMYVTDYKERQTSTKTIKKFKTKDLALIGIHIYDVSIICLCQSIGHVDQRFCLSCALLSGH